MSKSGRKSVNIPITSSAQGLKQDLETIARKRAITVSKVVAQIYMHAANNPGSYPNSLDDPRPKPGEHISSEVAISTADKLTEWAKNLGRSRAHHCCFILEYTLSDDNLMKAIFN
jgi:hypothetical protein